MAKRFGRTWVGRRSRCSSPGDSVGVLRSIARYPRPRSRSTSMRETMSSAMRRATMAFSGCSAAIFHRRAAVPASVGASSAARGAGGRGGGFPVVGPPEGGAGEGRGGGEGGSRGGAGPLKKKKKKHFRQPPAYQKKFYSNSILTNHRSLLTTLH